jgi:hypothetical protein
MTRVHPRPAHNSEFAGAAPGRFLLQLALGVMLTAHAWAVPSAAAVCEDLAIPADPHSLEIDVRADRQPDRGKAMGPLRVDAANRRYFADPSGRALFLAGSHTWNDLVDMGPGFPPRKLDFRAYLEFLQAHGHNALRLWAWEIPWRNDAIPDPAARSAAPQPWLRTGPGRDFGGQPRFDLTKLNPDYFRRLRERVLAARERDIYVIVMVFEAHVVQIVPTHESHPFFRTNNVNGTDFLDRVEDAYTLKYPQITALQQRYLRAVVDSVGDLDNVLFEIADEGGAYSTQWQQSMLRYLRCYETRKPLQHPIGLTFQIKGSNATLFASDADWISPGTESGHYATSPEPASGAKVILADTDHLGGASFADDRWPWHSLFRGMNLLYMDNYVGPASIGLQPTLEAAVIRSAVGMSRLVADQIDIGRFQPAGDITSTGYALRGADGAAVFAPDTYPFSLDMRSDQREFLTEWLDISSGHVVEDAPVHGGRIMGFQSPYPDGSVLYLRARDAHAQPLANISARAIEIRRNAARCAPWQIRLRLELLPYLRPLSHSFSLLMLSLIGAFVIGAAAGAKLAHLILRFRWGHRGR